MTETQEAIKYITAYCPHIGSFSNITYVGNVSEFLEQVALDIDKSPETAVLPGRTKEHVAYAVNAVAHHPFLSSPSVLAAAYLVTRFEFYFRILSGVLKENGDWIGGNAPSSVSSIIKDSRIKNNRISSVALAYKIMKLNASRQAAPIFDQLDLSLSSHWSPEITDIGKRIEWVRHPTGHGEMGDPSGEAIFDGLITAIIFYNQT